MKNNTNKDERHDDFYFVVEHENKNLTPMHEDYDLVVFLKNIKKALTELEDLIQKSLNSISNDGLEDKIKEILATIDKEKAEKYTNYMKVFFKIIEQMEYKGMTGVGAYAVDDQSLRIFSRLIKYNLDIVNKHVEYRENQKKVK